VNQAQVEMTAEGITDLGALEAKGLVRAGFAGG
jgi:hypothetical protein